MMHWLLGLRDSKLSFLTRVFSRDRTLQDEFETFFPEQPVPGIVWLDGTLRGLEEVWVAGHA
jgi:hypothetical protein